MILEQLERETGVPAKKIEMFVATASHRYKTYKIPKRQGGFRVIDHPTPDLKFLQRWLNRHVFAMLPVHGAAMAYRKGRSIRDAAEMHAKNAYLLKVDFENFFPSLTRNDVSILLTEYLLGKTYGFSAEDIEIAASIVCKGASLTIGAPSSPILSNSLLFDFDCVIAGVCNEKNVKYSRYADDLFFSTNTPNCLTEIMQVIRDDLRDRSTPRLLVNEKKTVFTSRKHKRVITGLTLTPEGRISIGRANKRALRTMIYLYSQQRLRPKDVSFTKGYLAFVSSVEPDLVMRLRRKFGDEMINTFMSEKTNMRKGSNSRPW